MRNKRFYVLGGILLLLVLFIKLYAASSQRVENGFSNGIYPPLAAFLRSLFGWMPFSLGDVLYGAFFLWVIWKLVINIRAIFKKQVTWRGFGRGSLRTLAVIASLYVLFNLLWGINYNRQGIASQLQLKMEKYSVEDLKNIMPLYWRR